jgi:excisionase family DNA binding protein
MEDKMRNTREAAAARTLAADMALANEAVLAELRGLRCDVRELIGVLRANRALDAGEGQPESEGLPAFMTLKEAAERLRTTRDALYQQIRRGTLPGVVRVGSRRLMVKTDEFLRDLPRMPTLE